MGTRTQVVEPDEPALNTAVGELPEIAPDGPSDAATGLASTSLDLSQYLQNNAEAVDPDRQPTPTEERMAAERSDTPEPDPGFAIELPPEPEPVVDPVPEPTPEERIAQLSEELAELLQVQAVTSRDQYPELLKVAMLEALAEEGRLDEMLGDGASTARLTPDELKILRAFRDLLSEARSRSPERSAELIAEIAEQLGAVRSLRIADAALCSRVLGFGRYEKINPTYTFVAGQYNPMIVYVQVDGFAHAPLDDETGAGWIVEISEELALYHVSDGQAVWSRPAQGVRDRAKVKVRDFYLIQEIELPRNLSVGKFSLKITIRDKTSGAVAEEVIPINVVAEAG